MRAFEYSKTHPLSSSVAARTKAHVFLVKIVFDALQPILWFHERILHQAVFGPHRPVLECALMLLCPENDGLVRSTGSEFVPVIGPGDRVDQILVS